MSDYLANVLNLAWGIGWGLLVMIGLFLPVFAAMFVTQVRLYEGHSEREATITGLKWLVIGYGLYVVLFIFITPLFMSR